MISLAELIDGLGGPSAVAARCGITPPAVTNWVMRNQVAAEHRIAIWAMAVDAGLAWKPAGADGLELSRQPAAPEAS